MKTTFALVLLLLAVAAGAQQPIDVAVARVNDRRTSGQFFAELNVSLELPKIQAAEVHASRVLVSSAVDDTGRDLVDREKQEPTLDPSAGSMMATNTPSPATVSLSLKNPDRKALKVKEVRGEIELYMPGRDPNSVAEIAKFASQTGKPLAHKALEANGVEIVLLTPAQVEAEKKRRAEAKKKEYAEMGFDAETLENMLKSFLETLLQVEESQLVARIKDPNGRIQSISYIDGAGELKNVSRMEEDGVTVLSTWGGAPAADWKMRVSMKTPKNVARYSFALSDVPLP
jgi:hypothetical protein